MDANPEQQEEDAKAHEKQGHQGDELFVDIPSSLGGGDLRNKKLGNEGHASDQQHHSQMGEDSSSWP